MTKLKWMYRKWIKGECRHFCKLCDYKYECFYEHPERHLLSRRKKRMNTFVRFTENGYKQLKEENSRLHDVIKHLIAENEEYEDALAELQERYNELREEVNA